MSSIVEAEPSLRKSKIGEPTWEVASLFPPQGLWSEADYLALETNKLIEFKNGVLEVLPMPNFLHQAMAILLVRLLQDFLGDRGVVGGAPFRVKLPNGAVREPDVYLLLNEHADRFGIYLWTGADLVVEIVSPGGEKRDMVEKRGEYAAAQIPEYWIVDPPTETVLVLKLAGSEYAVHGTFGKGDRLTSPLLTGFELDVTTLFSAGPAHLKNNAK